MKRSDRIIFLLLDWGLLLVFISVLIIGGYYGHKNKHERQAAPQQTTDQGRTECTS